MVESEECTENVGRELELEISIQQDGEHTSEWLEWNEMK